jgi:PAS domain S-box-containing protein
MATGDGSPGVTRHSTESHDATGHGRAEEALPESETILQRLLESASEAVVIVDGAGRIVLFSARAEEMFGYSHDELIGQTVETLIPGQFRDAHVRHRSDYVAHPRVRPMSPSLDLVGRRKDGTEFPVECGLSFIGTDGAGLTMSLIADITERKRAEEDLRESAERYRMIVDNTNEVIYKVSLEDDPLRGSVEFVSGQVKSILGYAPDEFLQNPELWLQIVHPDDVPALGKITHKTFASREPSTRQYRLRHKETGEYRWMEDKTVPLTDGDGNVVAYQGVARDITERKRTEDALQESDERYRTLVESAFEGIVIHRAGKILEANESFARMFGYELPEVIGLSPVEMTTPESAELIFNNVQSGFEKPYEITGVKKDGATFSIEVIGKNCVYQGREARITAFRDITEIKRAEEVRQQAREDLEGRVEHQILRRNPYGLTFRELTVLHLVAAGKSDKEIGIGLGISPLTARKHISNILAKMDAASRTEAVARCLREGLLD